MTHGARISHVHTYFPDDTLTNEDLCQIFPKYNTPDDIFRKSGIRTRYIHRQGETAADLSVACCRQLFDKHPELKDQVDFLIYCTSILDYVGPATCCLIHDQLGLSKTAGAIDLPMGCSGFTNGLAIAKAMIETGQAETILFITADTPTAVIHPEDAYMRILFSDIACASIVTRSDTPRIGQFCFGTDGSGGKDLIVYGSGGRGPVDRAWLDKYEDVGGMPIGRMEMNGEAILTFSLREVPPTINEILKRNRTTLDAIDWFVFHQPSGLILKFLTRKLGIPAEKVYSVLESVGNVVSASIPAALQTGIDRGDIREGQKLLLCGFGIGFSWSGTVIEL